MQDSEQDDHPDEEADDGDPRIVACVAAVIAAGGWVATDATSGVLRVVCGLVSLAAAGYAAYLLVLLVLFLVASRVLDDVGSTRRRCARSAIPWLIGLLILSWAMTAWLSGYDASEWLWTGVSIALGSAAIGIVGHRRRAAGARGNHGSNRPE